VILDSKGQPPLLSLWGLYKIQTVMDIAMTKIITFLALVLIGSVSNANNCENIKQPPLPSNFEYAIDYQQSLYSWISCYAYKNIDGVKVDKEVRQTGPFIALKDYGTHPAVRIWYSPEVVTWLENGRQNTKGHATSEQLPDGAFILKEMYLSPANIYNEIANVPPFNNDKKGEAYEAILEHLIGSWVIMIKDRNGPSADGWYWAQTEPNPNKDYQGAPNYNPSWLDNYTSTELDVYPPKKGGGREVPKPHFIYSGFSTGTCIRCHASASSESTFSTLDNIDVDKQGLQFRVDNSWRAESYLNAGSIAAPSLVEKLTTFKKEIKTDGQLVTINGRDIFDRLKPIWYLPDSQRPWVAHDKSQVDIRDAHLPAIEEQKEKLVQKSDESSTDKQNGKAVNKDFIDAFWSLTELRKQPTAEQIKRFSFPPAFADHSFSMKMNQRLPVDHPEGPMTPELQEYITSDNCVGCHGGLGGAPSGVSQFLQTGQNYGDGYNISPYGEWRWSPMGLAGRDPIFHSQIETELLILLKENGLLNKAKEPTVGKLADGKSLEQVRVLQQALVDTCLRCHGAMGLRQKGLNQTEEIIRKFSANFSKSDDAIQKLLTNKDRKILNPQFDPNNFYRTIPPSKETKPFIPWANTGLPPAPTNDHSNELGNLAREGISCTVCHHIAPPDSSDVGQFIKTAKASHPDWISDDGLVWTDDFFTFLATNNSGLYKRSEKDHILGPFDDVREKPMQHSLALTPQIAPTFKMGTHAVADQAFTSDSAMCGTCHTINLPNIGESIENEKNPILRLLQPNPVFQDIPHSIEQATYLEWLNSDFGPGLHNKKGPEFQSCQDCHMPNQSPPLKNGSISKPLAAQIATIQDSNYPFADHQLPSEDIEVPVRSDYRRHEMVGLNGFLLKMFEQNSDVLNVNLNDIETFANNGADLALNNMVQSTTEGRVAKLEISTPETDEAGANLVVDVHVKNNTGHRLPSGVTFRRVWIELLVKGVDEKVLWASGKSNNAGLILGPDNKQLSTEFLKNPDLYQPHYQEICSEDQVQIYEELVKNAEGEFTTSFVHRVNHVKDNRMLPRGWVPGDVFAGGVEGSDGLKDQGALLRQMMRATDPDGVGTDPEYNEKPGGDSIRYRIPLSKIPGAVSIEATLNSQAVTPSWLWERFSLANEAKQAGFDTPATDRLYYLASTLDLDDSALKGWKFKVTSAKRSIPMKLEVSKSKAQCIPEMLSGNYHAHQ
jgi:mono/diheme cytochrome c family protein